MPNIIKCAEAGCDSVWPDRSSWDAIKAHGAGWLLMKNGDAWCPEHLPEWVPRWRAKMERERKAEQRARKAEMQPGLTAMRSFWTEAASWPRARVFSPAINGTVVYRNNVRPAVMLGDGEIWFDTASRGERRAGAKTYPTFKPYTGKEEDNGS